VLGSLEPSFATQLFNFVLALSINDSAHETPFYAAGRLDYDVKRDVEGQASAINVTGLKTSQPQRQPVIRLARLIEYPR